MDNTLNTDALMKWRKWTEVPLVVLAIGSLPIVALDLISSRLDPTDRAFLFAVNATVFLAFAGDLLVKLFLLRRKPSAIKSEWPSFVIVFAQLLALIPSFGGLGALRAARGFRVFVAIARLFGIGGSARRESIRLLRTRAFSVAIGISGFTVVTSAVAFTLAEDVGVGRRVDSFFDALWWAAATVTTVGYGDIYPVTAIGRLVAVMAMIIGISSLAIVTARIAQFLIQSSSGAEGN